MPAWVDIELDKPRKIRFTYNDVVEVEASTGKGYFQLINSVQFLALRALLSQGLLWMDDSMTPVKAGKLLQEHWFGKGKSLKELSKVMGDALRAGGLLEPEEPTTETAEGNAQPEAASN